MKTAIVRLPVEDLPPKGPRLVATGIDAGDTPVARYLKGSNTKEPCRSGKPLVVLIRTMPLSTPDRVRVSVSREGWIFVITLIVRHYEGPLAANVITLALVQVELGSLIPGDYAIMVNEMTVSFMDLKRPRSTINPTMATQQFQVQVV